MLKNKKMNNKIKQYFEQGIELENINKMLNVSPSSAFKVLSKNYDKNEPFIYYNNEGEILFFASKKGKFIKRNTEKFDYEEVILNRVDGFFDFYDFIGEYKISRVNPGYTSWREHFCYIAKINRYKKLKDVDRTFYKNDFLETKFESKDSKSIDEIHVGNILQIKFYQKISNTKSYVYERFIYIKNIDNDKIEGLSANTYLRAKKISQMDIKSIL